MPIYSAAGVSTLVTATAAAPLFGFRGSTSNRTAVREIGIFGRTAPTTGGGFLGLVRSTALGTGSLTTVVGQAHEPGDPATTGEVVTVWGTAAPTVAAGPLTLRRWAQSVAIGNGIIWRFDDGAGLLVPLGSAATGELVIINLVAIAPGTYDFYVCWDE